MKFVLFLLFGMGVFALSLLGHKKYHNTTLYALAIGGVVNANYYHAMAYPVDCFGLPFGIDSLIYTLFAYCVMVVLLSDTKKSAYLLAFSSIIAIVVSALMELMAKLLMAGSTPEAWQDFGSFLISAFASVVAVSVAIEVIARCKERWNPYGCMALGIAIITLINSGIYYPVSSLVFTAAEDLWLYVGTSFMGKGIALVYSLLALWALKWLKARHVEE